MQLKCICHSTSFTESKIHRIIGGARCPPRGTTWHCGPSTQKPGFGDAAFACAARSPYGRPWAVSSAVERLVYTENVGGSIPSPPTISLRDRTRNTAGRSMPFRDRVANGALCPNIEIMFIVRKSTSKWRSVGARLSTPRLPRWGLPIVPQQRNRSPWTPPPMFEPRRSCHRRESCPCVGRTVVL